MVPVAHSSRFGSLFRPYSLAGRFVDFDGVSGGGIPGINALRRVIKLVFCPYLTEFCQNIQVTMSFVQTR
jgi:hypothetical protein